MKAPWTASYGPSRRRGEKMRTITLFPCACVAHNAILVSDMVMTSVCVLSFLGGCRCSLTQNGISLWTAMLCCYPSLLLEDILTAAFRYWGLVAYYSFRAYGDPSFLEIAIKQWEVVSSFMVTEEQAAAGTHPLRNITIMSQCSSCAWDLRHSNTQLTW